MPLPAAHWRYEQSGDKTIGTNCVCSGVPFTGTPCTGIFNRVRALVHRRTHLMCHSEERSDVAISQNTAGQLGSHRRNRNCLPEIATSACGLLAMTNLGADAILTPACTSRKFCAGPGCPLPYNSVCGWRSTREPAASMALSDHRYRQTPARRGRRRAGNCF